MRKPIECIGTYRRTAKEKIPTSELLQFIALASLMCRFFDCGRGPEYLENTRIERPELEAEEATVLTGQMLPQSRQNLLSSLIVWPQKRKKDPFTSAWRSEVWKNGI